MRRRCAVSAVAAAAAALLGLAACTATVGGTGHALAGSPTTARTPDFPAPSASGPGGGASGGLPSGGLPSGTLPSGPASGGFPSAGGPSGGGVVVQPSCPTVHDVAARLSYPCLAADLSFAPGQDGVWPVAFVRTVEPSTGWVVEEGSASWGPPDGQAMSDITLAVRNRLVDGGGYGENPSVRTVTDSDTTIGAARAHLLQTTITLDPSWASTAGTEVKTERLWIVALQVAANDISVWYASVPDLVSNLWPKVPAVITSITTG